MEGLEELRRHRLAQHELSETSMKVRLMLERLDGSSSNKKQAQAQAQAQGTARSIGGASNKPHALRHSVMSKSPVLLDLQMELSPKNELLMRSLRLYRAIRRLKLNIVRVLRLRQDSRRPVRHWMDQSRRRALKCLFAYGVMRRTRAAAQTRLNFTADNHASATLVSRARLALAVWSATCRLSRHTRTRQIDPLHSWTQRIALMAAWSKFKQWVSTCQDMKVSTVTGDLQRLRYWVRRWRKRVFLQGKVQNQLQQTHQPKTEKLPSPAKRISTPLRTKTVEAAPLAKSPNFASGLLGGLSPMGLPFPSPSHTATVPVGAAKQQRLKAKLLFPTPASAPQLPQGRLVVSPSSSFRGGGGGGPLPAACLGYTSFMRTRATSALRLWHMRLHHKRVSTVFNSALTVDRVLLEKMWQRWTAHTSIHSQAPLSAMAASRLQRTLLLKRGFKRVGARAAAQAGEARGEWYYRKKGGLTALVLLAALRFRRLRLYNENVVRLKRIGLKKLQRAVECWRRLLAVSAYTKVQMQRVRAARMAGAGRMLLRQWLCRRAAIANRHTDLQFHILLHKRARRAAALIAWYNFVFNRRRERSMLQHGQRAHRRFSSSRAISAFMAPLQRRAQQSTIISQWRRQRGIRMFCLRAMRAWKIYWKFARDCHRFDTKVAKICSRRACRNAMQQWGVWLDARSEAKGDERFAKSRHARSRCRLALASIFSRLVTVKGMKGVQVRSSRYRAQLLCIAALSALRAGHSLRQRRRVARALLGWRQRLLLRATRTWALWMRRRHRFKLRIASAGIGARLRVRSRKTRNRAGAVWGVVRARAALARLVARLLSPRQHLRLASNHCSTQSRRAALLRLVFVCQQVRRVERRAARTAHKFALEVGWDSMLEAMPVAAARRAHWAMLHRRAAFAWLHRLFHAIKLAARIDQQYERLCSSRALRQWARWRLREFQRGARRICVNTQRLCANDGDQHIALTRLRRGWKAGLEANVAFRTANAAFMDTSARKADQWGMRRALLQWRGWADNKVTHRREDLLVLTVGGARFHKKLALRHWQEEFVEMRQHQAWAASRAKRRCLETGWNAWILSANAARQLTRIHSTAQAQMRRAVDMYSRRKLCKALGNLVSNMMCHWARRTLERRRLAIVWKRWLPLSTSRRTVRKVLHRWHLRSRMASLAWAWECWQWGSRIEGLLDDHGGRRGESEASRSMAAFRYLVASAQWNRLQLERAALLQWRLVRAKFFWRSTRRQWSKAQTALEMNGATDHWVAFRQRRAVFILHLQLLYRKAAIMFKNKCFLHFKRRAVHFVNRRRFHRALVKLALRTSLRNSLRHWRREAVRIRRSRRQALREGNPYLELNKPRAVLEALKKREEQWYSDRRVASGVAALGGWIKFRAETRRTLAACDVYLAARSKCLVLAVLVRLRRERRKFAKRCSKLDAFRLERGVRRAFVDWTVLLCSRWLSRNLSRIAKERERKGRLVRGLRRLFHYRRP